MNGLTNQLLNQFLAILLQFKIWCKRCECRPVQWPVLHSLYSADQYSTHYTVLTSTPLTIQCWLVLHSLYSADQCSTHYTVLTSTPLTIQCWPVLHSLYSATNVKEYGNQSQCPAHPKNQLLNCLVAIVLQFTLCSTCYRTLWMYSNMRALSSSDPFALLSYAWLNHQLVS